MGFTWSSLPICKNSAMISLDCPVNHTIDFATMIDIFLSIFLWKKVVKMKRPTIRLLCYIYFFLLMIYCNFAIRIPIFHLGRQERPHPNSCFNFVWHINFIWIYKINNTIIVTLQNYFYSRHPKIIKFWKLNHMTSLW